MHLMSPIKSYNSNIFSGLAIPPLSMHIHPINGEMNVDSFLAALQDSDSFVSTPSALEKLYAYKRWEREANITSLFSVRLDFYAVANY